MKRKIILKCLFLVIAAMLASSIAGTATVWAASPGCEGKIDLQIALPTGVKCVTGLSEYIIEMYRFFIGSLGVIAVVVMMVGGFQWLMAAGNSQRIEEAKSTIVSALGGLVIGLGSFMILNIINPRLTDLKVGTIPPITPSYQLFQECLNEPAYACGTYFEMDPTTKEPIGSGFQGGTSKSTIKSKADSGTPMCKGIYCSNTSKRTDPTKSVNLGGCHPDSQAGIDFGDSYSCQAIVCPQIGTVLSNPCNYYNDKSKYSYSDGSTTHTARGWFQSYACSNDLCGIAGNRCRFDSSSQVNLLDLTALLTDASPVTGKGCILK